MARAGFMATGKSFILFLKIKILTFWYYTANVLTILAIAIFALAFCVESIATGHLGRSSWTIGLISKLTPYIGIVVLHGFVALFLIWKKEVHPIQAALLTHITVLILYIGIACVPWWNERIYAKQREEDKRARQEKQRIIDEMLPRDQRDFPRRTDPRQL